MPRNSIEISQRRVEGIAIIDLAGEIDLYNSGSLKSTLNELIAQRQYRIILNMKRVSYMDSTAIGVMVNVLLALKQNKGDLKLAQAEASIQKVMRLTHLDDFLQLCDSEEAAIAAFGKG